MDWSDVRQAYPNEWLIQGILGMDFLQEVGAILNLADLDITFV